MSKMDNITVWYIKGFNENGEAVETATQDVKVASKYVQEMDMTEIYSFGKLGWAWTQYIHGKTTYTRSGEYIGTSALNYIYLVQASTATTHTEFATRSIDTVYDNLPEGSNSDRIEFHSNYWFIKRYEGREIQDILKFDYMEVE